MIPEKRKEKRDCVSSKYGAYAVGNCGGVGPLLGHNKKIHTKVRKSNDSSKFADRVVRGSLEEMLLFYDQNGRCNNAMKLVINKMVLNNAYIKIKSDLGNSSRVEKAIFDAISDELFEETSNKLGKERFSFKPIRKILIPKGDTSSARKMRPLAIGSPFLGDIIVQ